MLLTGDVLRVPASAEATAMVVPLSRICKCTDGLIDAAGEADTDVD